MVKHIYSVVFVAVCAFSTISMVTATGSLVADTLQQTNLALGKTAQGSSLYNPSWALPSAAVDGDLSTFYLSRAFDNPGGSPDEHPWLMVDLGAVAWVEHLQLVILRSDCCQDQTVGAIVQLSETSTRPADTDFVFPPITQVAVEYDIVLAPRSARYVWVYQTRSTGPPSNHLQVAELRVLGFANVAVQKATTASSFYNDAFVTSKAVDEDPNTFYISKAAPADRNPWFKLDLGAVFWVSHIEMLNRPDCCQDRPVGAIVQITVDDMRPNSYNWYLTRIFHTAARFQTVVQPAQRARYVWVQQPREDDQNNLEIAELRVYATAELSCPKFSQEPVQTYLDATGTCAARGQRLCTAGELDTLYTTRGCTSIEDVWALANMGDVQAPFGSGSFSIKWKDGLPVVTLFFEVSRTDFFTAKHHAACCPYGDIGVDNRFLTSMWVDDATLWGFSCPSSADQSIDLNKGTDGHVLFMCNTYTRASQAHVDQHIVDIQVTIGENAKCPGGYTKYMTDLNTKAGDDFIYFCVLSGDASQTLAIADAYVAVGSNGDGAGCVAGYDHIGGDLNSGVKGSPDLYLCLKRTDLRLTALGDPSGDLSRIRQFVPAFHVHWRERFFPTSIDTLLQGGASGIFQNNGKQIRTYTYPITPLSAAPACASVAGCTPIWQQSDFLAFAGVSEENCFGFAASDESEDPADWEAWDRAKGKLYYSVAYGPSYAMITYTLLYRWNGCLHYFECENSVRGCTDPRNGNPVQHMGDIERVSVLVDQTFSRTIGIENEAHGSRDDVDVNDYAYFSGDRQNSGPDVYVAAETHGMYGTNSFSYSESQLLQDCHKCTGCPKCGCYDDPNWRPDGDQLARVGRKPAFPHVQHPNDWVDGQEWQQFTGRFGCGGNGDSVDKTGVGSFSKVWYVKNSTMPPGYLNPQLWDESRRSWHSIPF